MKAECEADALVIGGGFYGVAVAIHLKTIHKMRRVVLCEQEDGLMLRASRINQARVHTGYHYPRSYVTAYRSRRNMPSFLTDWSAAIYKDFTKLYAIAALNSKVSARQFELFCSSIGAPLKRAPDDIKKLFNHNLIEEVFLAEEYAFDCAKMSSLAYQRLKEADVEVCVSTKVRGVKRGLRRGLLVDTEQGDQPAVIETNTVFNCTYSSLNQFGKDYPSTVRELKHELAEMACVSMPASLKEFGITVMDGPFFSVMPYPSKGLHTLSHVRYTPRKSWEDKKGEDPQAKLVSFGTSTSFERMVRDASRYVPGMAQAKYEMSLVEVKTVLARNEADDGRPILFERHEELPGSFAILGGKIDNIYDILQHIDHSLGEQVTV